MRLTSIFSKKLGCDAFQRLRHSCSPSPSDRVLSEPTVSCSSSAGLQALLSASAQPFRSGGARERGCSQHHWPGVLCHPWWEPVGLPISLGGFLLTHPSEHVPCPCPHRRATPGALCASSLSRRLLSSGPHTERTDLSIPPQSPS